MSSYDEYDTSMREQVEEALVHVRRVLDVNRNPVYAADAQHRYSDKYMLSEFLTNTAVSSVCASMFHLGFTLEHFMKMIEWASTRAVTVRFKCTERCSFSREAERKETSKTKRVISSNFGLSLSSKSVQTITEYFWKFSFLYEIEAFAGAGEFSNDVVCIQSQNASQEIKTNTFELPRSDVYVRDAVDVNITWLLHLITPTSGSLTLPITPTFKISRQDHACHTPRRNDQVESAVCFFKSFSAWCNNVYAYFTENIFPIQQVKSLDMSAINATSVFIPVVPLLEEIPYHIDESCYEISRNESKCGDAVGRHIEEHAEHTSVLKMEDMNAFLVEEQRTLMQKIEQIKNTFCDTNSSNNLITSVHGQLLSVLHHMRDVCLAFKRGVDFIEDMLRHQLVSAIGKVITPLDFAVYMNYHFYKLFRNEYAPRPFCHVVRRSTEHSPEGILSIEQNLGTIPEPVVTQMSHESGSEVIPMSFSLSASASVTFTGERYLHALLMHCFERDSSGPAQLMLRAQSRQFSSYIVLIGRISGPYAFEPKYGILVQNKDEISIPLDLHTIPSAKAFKDAISSLSPEQQRFAKAFRSMQLESTMFGMCVIQIKPLLEKVLNLPPDSLTKEIQLTQDLIELFVKYHIPSDLLSYSSHAAASLKEKLTAVKSHVAAMHDMLGDMKEQSLEDQKLEKSYDGASLPSVCSMSASDSYESDMDDNECEDDCFMDVADFNDIPCRRLSEVKECNQDEGRGELNLSTEEAVPEISGKNGEEVENDGENSTINSSHEDIAAVPDKTFIDLTKLPKLLDKRFEQLDDAGAVRPTIINPGELWYKKWQKSLLSMPETAHVGVDEQQEERNKCFDLIDALTKSGGLEIDSAQLHVVVAATHCFDSSLLDTCIRKNINPIERVEQSTVVMASTIHGKNVSALVKSSEMKRLLTYSPALLKLDSS